MKIKYFSKDGTLGFEADVSTDIEAFTAIAKFQEIFENDAVAEIDGQEVVANDVRFVVRDVDYKDDKGKTKSATYYEKRVMSGPMRYYKKEYGLGLEKPGMFPKASGDHMRELEKQANENGDKLVLGKNGWYNYRKNRG